MPLDIMRTNLEHRVVFRIDHLQVLVAIAPYGIVGTNQDSLRFKNLLEFLLEIRMQVGNIGIVLFCLRKCNRNRRLPAD